MERLGLLAGSVYEDLLSGETASTERVSTHFGETSIRLTSALAFLPRHGTENNIPPHRINHQANVAAFRRLGISRVIGLNSTGSLRRIIPPRTLLVPHDYINPWGIKTIYDERIHHITPGLDQDTRKLILNAAMRAKIEVMAGGVYVQTTGPRLETKAEIQILKLYGDVVGMTMASEATLAKEFGIAYASVCSVDNFCHGIIDSPLREEDILRTARQNVETVKTLIQAILEAVTWRS